MGRDSATFWDRSSFIVPGQRDNGTILPWDGTGQDSLSKSRTGGRKGQSLFFCQNPGRDSIYFLSFPVLEHLSCFRTSFPVLERPLSVLGSLCFSTSFFGFTDF